MVKKGSVFSHGNSQVVCHNLCHHHGLDRDHKRGHEGGHSRGYGANAHWPPNIPTPDLALPRDPALDFDELDALLYFHFGIPCDIGHHIHWPARIPIIR